MALVNQKYGRQGQANFVLYPLATQYPAAFHDVKNGNNSVPCSFSPTSPNCISVSSPLTVTDPNLGTATEGQIGTGSTAQYNATAGFDLGSGLGTVDANVLVADWNKVTFSTSSVTLSSPTAGTYAHGSNVTVTAKVTGSSPTGDVALMTDSKEPTQQGQDFFTLSSGTATGTIDFLPGGTYNVWGHYGGDSKNKEADSAKTLITVTPESSGVFLQLFGDGSTISSGTGNIPYGTFFQFNALVAPSSKLAALEACFTSSSACPSYGVPTGVVTFSDNGTKVNTAVINAEGDAEYAPYDPITKRAVTSVGSHSITASFPGDASYNSSTSSATTFTVVKATPSLQAEIVSNPQRGQAIPIYVLVQSNGNGAAPTGTVTLSGAPSGTPTSATIVPEADNQTGSNGVATITIPATAAAGTYNLTINYNGDANYNSAAPVGGSLTITPASSQKASTTAITANMSATSPAALVSLTVTVTGSGTTAPTGTIDFVVTGFDFGSFPLTAVSGTDRSTVTVSGDSGGFLQGANLITAVYSGDGTYASSNGTINISNNLSDFSIIPQTTIVPVTAGGSGTDTINLYSVNGFSGAVSFTCAGTTVTCSVPSSATLSAGGTTPLTLTINAASSVASGNYNVIVTGKDSTGKYVHTLAIQARVTGAIVSGLQFIPVTPCRVVDTRNATGPFGGPEMGAGTSRTFNIPQSACGIPSTAVAYSLNVTVVPGGALNYLTMWPAGQAQPNVSTLNSDGRVKANAAITPAGTNGGVSIFVSNATNVILDIDGYFVPAGTASALAFYPVTPCRVADTRTATGPLGGPSLGANSSRAFPVQSSSCGIPSTAKAYSLNVTAIPHSTLNYLTSWPTGQAQPNVSTLNSSTGAVTANAAIEPAGTSGQVSIFVSDAADVILDINGYFAPPATGGLSLYTVAPCRIIDTRTSSGSFSGVLPVNVEGSVCAPSSTAQAYVLNATVVPPGPLNYLTLWPDGQTQPNVSTLNANDGAVTSNMAIVPTNNGKIDAFAYNPTDLILDISSYFAP